VARKLGIEMGGWHDFSHTLSTRLLKKWPTNVVSEMLGHSMQTTMEIYEHVQSEDFRAPLSEMPSVTKPLRSDATVWDHIIKDTMANKKEEEKGGSGPDKTASLQTLASTFPPAR